MFSLFSNTGNDSPRQKTEKELAHEFISILQRHHRNIQRSTGGPEAAAAAAAVGDDDDLLAGINMTERKILSGVTYQNWMAGMAAGALTFGVLMGISLRSAAAAQRYKLPRRASAAVRDIDHIATTTSHRGGGGGSGSNNRAKVVKTISVGKHKRPHSGRRPSDNNHEKMLESSVVRQPSEAMDPTSLRSEIMSEGTRCSCWNQITILFYAPILLPKYLLNIFLHNNSPVHGLRSHIFGGDHSDVVV